ncbi:DUF2510 domain-containing protein [Rathayibacter soli]
MAQKSGCDHLQRGISLSPTGWYPAPSDASTSQWWDGTNWTEHKRVPEGS